MKTKSAGIIPLYSEKPGATIPLIRESKQNCVKGVKMQTVVEDRCSKKEWGL